MFLFIFFYRLQENFHKHDDLFINDCRIELNFLFTGTAHI